MGFSKGGVLHKLWRYGLLDGYKGATSANSDNKKRMKMILAARIANRQCRKQKYQEERRNGIWEDHVAMCLHKDGEKAFETRYHMTKPTFDKLCDTLHLPVDEV